VEEDQKKNLERELYELRQQVNRSVGASSETDELRRSLEKSERQRMQLSDHIEVGDFVFIIVDAKQRNKGMFWLSLHWSLW